ncbi:MAG: LysM peptidoglycan-binding domain-containing protein [Planctomycetota bacterium]
MELNTKPALVSPTPGSGNVIATLKRNVLWGALGLVALVFTTVCVMYYTSRQSAATPVTAAVTPAPTPSAADTTPAAPAGLDGKSAAAPGTLASATDAGAATPPPVAGATVPAPTDGKSTPVSTDGASAKTVSDTLPARSGKVAKHDMADAKSEGSSETKTLDVKNIPHGTKVYVVKPGDTLEKIAREIYGDGHKWRRLAELNKPYVGNSNRLKVGQKILVERVINPRDYADY